MAVPELALSHFGFFVHDLARMERFYTEVLGFVVTDRGDLRGQALLFLSRDPTEHHQIVMAAGRTGKPDEKVINQLSFRVGSLDDLKTFHGQIAQRTDIHDIAPITHGNAWSVYFRDPEGNRIEVFVDAPWYVTQPRREALDLSLPTDEIMRQTEAAIRDDPGFMPVAQWQADFKTRLSGSQH
ncbi:MAG: VOC family protein [Pseudomonadota bacterium]